jgi:hypothetical protein
MNKSLKQSLLAGVAGAALAMGMSIGSANAFNYVDWSFDLSIDPCVNISVDLDPSSMTTVEADQLSVGDIRAISVVKDIDVDQPGSSYSHYHHHSMSSALDATTQLGDIVSAATAVANNVNVDTNTAALFANINQTALGAYFSIGEVTAKSIVKDIDNLSVDSSATAVSNNVNLSQVVAHLGDTTAVANVEQKSFMDVKAVSVVKDVDLKNYSNLGLLTTPVISSTATAVGNNLNVSVTKVTP